MDTSQRELELIRKVQRNNDIFAMKELLRLFRGTIQKCIREANLSSAMDETTAIAYAENIVRHALKENFDPNKKVPCSSCSIVSGISGRFSSHILKIHLHG